MTAACAAIWLADKPPVAGPEAWLLGPIPTCDRLEVLVEGRVGSNMPWVAACFLEWVLRTGDDEPWAAVRGAAGRGYDCWALGLFRVAWLAAASC